MYTGNTGAQNHNPYLSQVYIPQPEYQPHSQAYQNIQSPTHHQTPTGSQHLAPLPFVGNATVLVPVQPIHPTRVDAWGSQNAPQIYQQVLLPTGQVVFLPIRQVVVLPAGQEQAMSPQAPAPLQTSQNLRGMDAPYEAKHNRFSHSGQNGAYDQALFTRANFGRGRGYERVPEQCAVIDHTEVYQGAQSISCTRNDGSAYFPNIQSVMEDSPGQNLFCISYQDLAILSRSCSFIKGKLRENPADHRSQVLRPADIKLGGVNSEAQAEALVGLVTFLTSKKVQAVDLFRGNCGLCSMWLEPSTDETSNSSAEGAIELFNKVKVWMGPRDKGVLIATDKPSQDNLKGHCAQLKTFYSFALFLPRHLVSIQKWEDRYPSSQRNDFTRENDSSSKLVNQVGNPSQQGVAGGGAQA